ncbi:MAG: hypothetical protein KDA24_08910 [Deltaproteobacteria bacterium]|nr:hypothetical protein [Deltaproteobacteria bacterium]
MTDETTPAPPSLETLVVAFMGADGGKALREASNHAAHLKAMWERLRVGKAGGVDFVGIPIGNKVNDDSIENHSRHLHSLLRLLGLPLTNSYMDVKVVEVPSDTIGPVPEPSPDPS